MIAKTNRRSRSCITCLYGCRLFPSTIPRGVLGESSSSIIKNNPHHQNSRKLGLQTPSSPFYNPAKDSLSISFSNPAILALSFCCFLYWPHFFFWDLKHEIADRPKASHLILLYARCRRCHHSLIHFNTFLPRSDSTVMK